MSTTLQEISRPSSSASDALRYHSIPSPAIVDSEIQAPASGYVSYEDVVGYVDTLRNELQGQPQVFCAFMTLMSAYHHKMIDEEGVRARVSLLFAGYPALLRQFITVYLPGETPDHVAPPANVSPLTVISSSDEKSSTVLDVLRYLDPVKTTLKDEPNLFNSFLHAHRELKSGNVDVPELMKRVALLFHGHSDLVERFNGFLPVEYRITSFPNGIIVTTPTETIVVPPSSLSAAGLDLQES